MSQKKILMIGYGNMGKPVGEAIAKALNNEVEITIVNPSPRGLLDGMKFFAAEKDLPRDEKYDVLILAIKPQNAASIAPQYDSHLAKNAVVFSIMAGISSDKIKKFFKNEVRVVRAMPNVCASIGKSSTGFAIKEKDNFSDAEKKFIYRLIASFGEAIAVDEEKINAITAVAGSGPAYVFYVLELITQALVTKSNYGYDEAKNIVLEIVGAIGDRPLTSENCTGERRSPLQMQDLIHDFFASAEKNSVTEIIKNIIANFSDAYIKAAQSLGFSELESKKLIHSVIKNSAELAKFSSEKSFSELKASVTSKNGTTFHGLAQLTSSQSLSMDEILQNTIQAAFKRAEELNTNS